MNDEAKTAEGIAVVCWLQDAERAIRQVRQLCERGKFAEAIELINKAELGHV